MDLDENLALKEKDRESDESNYEEKKSDLLEDENDLAEKLLLGLRKKQTTSHPIVEFPRNSSPTSSPTPSWPASPISESFTSPSSPTISHSTPSSTGSNTTSAGTGTTSSTTPSTPTIPVASFSKLQLGVQNQQNDRTRGSRWTEHFNQLLEFKSEYGHTNVTQTKSKTLAEWVKNQRRLRKADKLAQSRIDNLDSIGFEWDRSYLFKNKRSPTERDIDESQPMTLRERKRKIRNVFDSASDSGSDEGYD